MTHQATGKVVELTVRNLVSKAGKPFTKHGVKLDSGQEYELDGFKQRHAVGDAVDSVGVALKYKVWTETGGYGKGLPAMPIIASPMTGASAPTSSYRGGASSGGSDKGGFPVSSDNYQMAIIRQNALTNAVNMLGGVISSVVPTNSDELAKHIDERADMAIKVAYKFASFSSGHFDAIAAEEVAKEVKGILARGSRGVS